MADKPIMTDVNINGQTEKFADPQHFTGSNNEGRAKTGEKNPFPTKDDKVLAKLNEIDNRLSKIESGDTTLNTQLTGSNVEFDKPIPIVDINRNKEQIKTPLGFRWKNHFLNDRIYFIPETQKFHTDFDMSEMKYESDGRKYYVDNVRGSNSNDGLSKDTPFKTIRKALEQEDAGTVMVAGGLYTRREALHGFIEKSVNIISYDGNAKLSMSEDLVFSKHDTLDNVYVANNSEMRTVFDAKLEDDDGDYSPLSLVNSAEEVNDSPHSYYIDGNTIYVRTYDDRKPDDDIRVYLLYNNIIRGDVHVYLEGIEFEGGAMPVWAYSTDKENVPNVYLKNCTVKYSISSNGIRVEGCNVFSQNVFSSKNAGDGFNYHSKNGVTCKAIEINCAGKDNGSPGATTTNGSSIHDGGSIIRLGGEYIRNYGPNVADVNESTQSWNLGTIAFKSLSEIDNQNSDFTADGDMDMWLDNVIGYGSKQSLDAREGSKIYVRNSVFTTEEVAGDKYKY